MNFQWRAYGVQSTIPTSAMIRVAASIGTQYKIECLVLPPVHRVPALRRFTATSAANSIEPGVFAFATGASQVSNNNAKQTFSMRFVSGIFYCTNVMYEHPTHTHNRAHRSTSASEKYDKFDDIVLIKNSFCAIFSFGFVLLSILRFQPAATQHRFSSKVFILSHETTQAPSNVKEATHTCIREIVGMKMIESVRFENKMY